MAVFTSTFLNWRSTLVSMQSSLGGTLTTAQSAYGYSLLATLNTTGMEYDTSADDSPRNVSLFSIQQCQPYMIAAVPAFAEIDRVSRLAYSTFASQATLTDGQTFGLYAGLTTLPAGLQAPAALVLLWDTSASLWTTVQNRYATALTMAGTLGHTVTFQNTALTAQLNAAAAAAAAYVTPPVDPSPPAASLSHTVTVNVNAAIANCTQWISSLAFS